jgi:murein L,D-transpeptidase YcbB/YkuD
MVQFQGDAVGLPGTTSTVDLNEFLPHSAGSSGYDTMLRLSGHPNTRAFQAAHGLVADGIIGPKTFAALAR